MTRPLTSSGPSGDARERWNRRYRAGGLRAFARSPSPWLTEQRALLTELSGRRALDVACGDGRNAGYLASELGFEVDAVDLLAVRGATLEIAGLDLDGTPVVDIKPYVPAFDAVEAERTGWLEQGARRVFEVRADARCDEGSAD